MVKALWGRQEAKIKFICYSYSSNGLAMEAGAGELATTTEQGWVESTNTKIVCGKETGEITPSLSFSNCLFFHSLSP